MGTKRSPHYVTLGFMAPSCCNRCVVEPRPTTPSCRNGLPQRKMFQPMAPSHHDGHVAQCFFVQGTSRTQGLGRVVQALGRDLTMFGFFTSLGNNTCATKGVGDSNEYLSSLLRYVVITKSIQFFLYALCEPMKDKWISLAPIRCLFPSFFLIKKKCSPIDPLLLIRRTKETDWKSSKL